MGGENDEGRSNPRGADIHTGIDRRIPGDERALANGLKLNDRRRRPAACRHLSGRSGSDCPIELRAERAGGDNGEELGSEVERKWDATEVSAYPSQDMFGKNPYRSSSRFPVK